MVKREDLSNPRASRRIGVTYDAEAFGQFSESIARYLGTARYLVWQTVIVIVWLAWNWLMPSSLAFDPWDQRFAFLTLLLSLQASYAAPLILLAQNRQEGRDRLQSANDRRTSERSLAETEFLARELAGVRVALSDVVTAEDLRDQLRDLSEAIAVLSAKLDAQSPPAAAVGNGSA